MNPAVKSSFLRGKTSVVEVGQQRQHQPSKFVRLHIAMGKQSEQHSYVLRTAVHKTWLFGSIHFTGAAIFLDAMLGTHFFPTKWG